MIAIKLTDTNQWLELPTNISLRYEMLFPAFDMEAMQANVVYPFEFPVMGNEETLNHANVIQVNRTTRKYNVAFYVHGVMIFGGEMYVKSSAKTFSASIYEKGLMARLAETSVRDMSWEIVPGSTILTIAYDAIAKNWPDAQVNFPTISAPSCYGNANSANETFDGYVNNYNRAGHYFESNTFQVDEEPPENVNAMAPLPFLFEVFKQMETFFGVKFTGSTIENTDLQQLLISNMVLADKGADSLYCALYQTATSQKYYPAQGLINDPLLEDWILWLLEHEDVDDLWNGYRYEITEKGYHTIKAAVTVDWSQQDPNEQVILWVRMGDAEAIGYALEIGDNGHAEINYEVDFYAFAADIGKPIYFALVVEKALNTWVQPTTLVSEFEVFNRTTAALNAFDNEISIGDYLPNIPASTLINQFRLLTGSATFIDSIGRVIEVSSLESILQSDFVDLTANMSMNDVQLECLDDDSFKLKWDWTGENREDVDTSKFETVPDVVLNSMLPSTPMFGEVCRVLSEKNYYAHYFDLDPITWKKLSDCLGDMTIGAGQTEIPTTMAPIRAIFQDDAVFPYVEAEFLSKLFNTGSENDTIRLLNWHGMKNDVNGLAYPFASCGSYDSEGNEISNIDIDWNGEKGLYEFGWKRWLQFLSTQDRVTSKLSIGLNEFLQIRNLFMPQVSSKKTRKIRLANVDYVPEKVSVIFTNSETWECEAILRKKGTIVL